MRTAIILSLSFFFPLFIFCQKQSIELELTGKYGVHSKYTRSAPGFFYLYPTIKVSGSSAGLSLNYKRALGKKLYGKIGAGFNRLTADKVESSDGGETIDTRSFNYTYLGNGSTFYHTGKYHYNNLMFTGGASYEKNCSKNLKLTFGGDIVYLYSIAQRYYPGATKEGSNFKNSEKFSLALGLNANAGVLYKIKNSKFYVNPKLVLPLYQRMFADKMLTENNDYDRPQKWLGGGGLSISIGKYF